MEQSHRFRPLIGNILDRNLGVYLHLLYNHKALFLLAANSLLFANDCLIDSVADSLDAIEFSTVYKGLQ